jgi:hypothetical protein
MVKVVDCQDKQEFLHVPYPTKVFSLLPLAQVWCELRRTPFSRTSENSFKANFREFLFPALE